MGIDEHELVEINGETVSRMVIDNVVFFGDYNDPGYAIIYDKDFKEIGSGPETGLGPEFMVNSEYYFKYKMKEYLK